MKNYPIVIAVLIFIISLLSYSCKVKPIEAYQQIYAKAEAEGIDEPESSTSTHLSVNIAKRSELTLEDPVLKYDESHYSNYKRFHFEVDSSETYYLKIYSFNSGGGRNYIFDPMIKVFGNEGKVIDAVLDKEYYDYDDIFSINKIWKLGPGIDGECHLLVYSNNNDLEKPITSGSNPTMIYTGSVFVPLTIPYAIYSSLIGDFNIWLVDSKGLDYKVQGILYR